MKIYLEHFDIVGKIKLVCFDDFEGALNYVRLYLSEDNLLTKTGHQDYFKGMEPYFQNSWIMGTNPMHYDKSQYTKYNMTAEEVFGGKDE